MKKILYIMTAFGIILFGGCNDRRIDSYGYYSKSYIQSFTIAETLSAVLAEFESGDIWVGFSGKRLYNHVKADAKDLKRYVTILAT